MSTFIKGNLARARVTKMPTGTDPATAHAVLEHAAEFGYHVRDLIERGHQPRVAIEIALKAAGTYDLLKARPGAMERIFAYFEKEVDRLTTEADSGRKIVRGVPIVPKGKADAVLYSASGAILKKVSGE